MVSSSLQHILLQDIPQVLQPGSGATVLRRVRRHWETRGPLRECCGEYSCQGGRRAIEGWEEVVDKEMTA